MTLDELKEEAQKILSITPSKGFEHIAFSCNSGGAPANNAGVQEVSRIETRRYSTTRNGDAYSGEVIVDAKNTGRKDVNGRKIYLTPDGIVFVFHYYSGSPESFDGGVLTPPKLNTNQ